MKTRSIEFTRQMIGSITRVLNNYNVLATDYHVLCDSEDALTVSLETPLAGRILFISNIGVGEATIDCPPGVTINGLSTLTLKQDVSLSLQGTSSTLWSIVSMTNPYKVYTALASQTGDDAPAMVILETTLAGTVVYARTSAGVFTCTSAGEFTSKTYISPALSNYVDSNGNTIRVVRTNINVITITTLSEGVPTDGILNDFPLRIKVYK